jgi:hypothetical protein
MRSSPSLARFHKLTDGTLGAPLEKLERAALHRDSQTLSRQETSNRNPAPLQGRSAFASHTAALRKIIGEML